MMKKYQNMVKKKVGIITFHASHNYGSMLQAYALQQTVLGMGFDCEIINFRTKIQTELFKPPFMRGTVLGKVKRFILFLPFNHSLLGKYELFEKFLVSYFKLSDKKFSSLSELNEANLPYDVIISGSDQIWNTYCHDFDWAYFLPFAKSARRVAYAPSMGPEPNNSIKAGMEQQVRLLLESYDAISVRDSLAQEKLKKLADIECPVMIDPTLLLPVKGWHDIAGDTPIVNGKYIFLYTPWYKKSVFDVAMLISKDLKLPVVVSQLYDNWKYNSWIVNKDFKSHISTGPKEFLNLCRFATCTIGASFHVVVFSILLRTPFYAIDGMKDSRVAELLTMTGLESRSWDLHKAPLTVSLNIDFKSAIDRIEFVRNNCIEWLYKELSNSFALDIQKKG